MATTESENLGLTLQDDNEFVSIEVTAENFRKIDEAFGKIQAQRIRIDGTGAKLYSLKVPKEEGKTPFVFVEPVILNDSTETDTEKIDRPGVKQISHKSDNVAVVLEFGTTLYEGHHAYIDVLMIY